MRKGANKILARADNGASDCMTLYGVTEHNRSYDLSLDALIGSNWFDEATGEPLVPVFPEGYYSIRDTLGALLAHPQTAAILQSLQNQPQVTPAAGNSDAADEQLAMFRTLSLLHLAKMSNGMLLPADLMRLNKALNQIPKV